VKREFSGLAGLKLALVMVVIAGLALALAGPVRAAAAGPSTPLTVTPTLKTGPRTDGHTVVWLEGNVLKAENLSDQTVTDVVTLKTRQAIKQFDMDGSYVIWEQYDSACAGACDGPVYGQNLATGQTFRVSPEAYGRNIAVSGNYAVYVTDVPGPNNFGEGIRVRNLATLADPVTVCILYAIEGALSFDGDRLLWGQTLASYQTGTGKERWQLVTMRLDDASPTVLDQADFDDYGTLNLGGWDLKGDLAVYSVNQQLRAVNLATGERRLITDPARRPAQNPTTNGRYIFWEDPRNFNADSPLSYPQALQGYDFPNGSYLGNVVPTGNNSNPRSRGDLLVWNSGDAATRQMVAAPLAGLLPNALQPANRTADYTYFPQTGHNLGGNFKAYWAKNGGLNVFGYPTTDEFQELNRDTGQIFTVQYFERQRFEYHPENKGTPYEVLLGRLGADEAQRRGFTNNPPFRPAKNSGQAHCRFFPETQHNVCNSFMDYWQAHGLDLSDPGNSYRESLALFGLPLSEPFTDPASGVTVQYFERAIFEHHPENQGTGFEVLLSLLGNQALKNRAWQ
jgi:hypothetical protein